MFRPGALPRPPIPGDYVVFFGALAPWQGIETMLAAVRRPDWPGGVHLVIAGDGVERPAVEAEAARDKRIIYLGRIPQRDVPGLVAHSLAGLCPISADVGHSPLKVYETLAAGVPVVVTEVPGQVELVRDNRCGLVIPPKDPAALASAIATLAGGRAEREEMGCRGRRLIEMGHSWRRRADELCGVLQQLVE